MSTIQADRPLDSPILVVGIVGPSGVGKSHISSRATQMLRSPFTEYGVMSALYTREVKTCAEVLSLPDGPVDCHFMSIFTDMNAFVMLVKIYADCNICRKLGKSKFVLGR